ncbi:MAG TPA: 16S rRNA (adenine(1518)-N(6)/adenine(1519)-N(6))-dimethyltransferase RsmA [Candidatus Paceibacterota bacterium]|nr:16S rRNA (adenine(1518)-N(6)/adenine(1519)-N(6))-dimethyltransferase RsmA [Candidatus Paceibacterota bacterium]
MSIEAKKTLGQHFLRSDKAIREIVEAGHIVPGDVILEIGPGEGVLTEALLSTGAHIIAIEMDQRCIPILHERFKKEEGEGRFQLLEGDVRNPELLRVLFGKSHIGNKPYKLIANIPYYITGLLFRMFLETTPPVRQPTLMVYLIQKEVAEQLVGRDGKYGNLALAAMLYGKPRIVAKVPKGAFLPPPKVDSSIIAIEDISRKNISGFSEKTFFMLTHAGLASRRKMLLTNLVNVLKVDRTRLQLIFERCGINEKVRAEDLKLADWIMLAREIEQL